jgi:hypothetical protein
MMAASSRLLTQNPVFTMQIVEVFKTNVWEDELAKHLIVKLLDHFPQHKINFDLQDCDKILRVEGEQVSSKRVIEVINTNGYECEVLQ